MTDIGEAKEILAKAMFLPPERFDDKTNFRQMPELDSLSFEALVLEIETRVGRDFDLTKLIDVRTVSDLRDLMRELRRI